MKEESMPDVISPHEEKLPRSIPKAEGFDNTLKLLSEGYEFIRNRCKLMQTDVFETRLLFRKTICMLGEDAAALFYDNDKFIRQGVMPGRVQKTLVGVGGVQGLDGKEHRHRKSMFTELLMNPERIAELVEITKGQWKLAGKQWRKNTEIVLYDEAQHLFFKSVCVWANVPLKENEVRQRARDLAEMIKSGAKLGLEHWRGRWARRRSERWISGLINDIRNTTLKPGPDLSNQSILYSIAMHRDLDGGLLPVGVAAVEVLNVLRPVVAIAQPLTFAALALHRYPQCRHALLLQPQYMEYFIQEVRRFYPFFPFAAAKVKAEFLWKGYTFKKYRRVLLDLHGTNRNAKSWAQPDEFKPERFIQQEINAYNFIPNGGGSYEQHHRCPGEYIVLALMKVALNELLEMNYSVTAQNLKVDMSKIPALPANGLILRF